MNMLLFQSIYYITIQTNNKHALKHPVMTTEIKVFQRYICQEMNIILV